MKSSDLYNARINFIKCAQLVEDIASGLRVTSNSAPDARAISLDALHSSVSALVQAHYEWDQVQMSFRIESKPIGIK